MFYIFQQIIIKSDFSKEFKNECIYYIIWALFFTGIIRLLEWLSHINDLSVYTTYESFMIITGFLFFTLSLPFSIRYHKDFDYRKQHFNTILVINEMMIRSIYLNKLKGFDTHIKWEDISKILIHKYCKDVSKDYKHHLGIYAYHLSIELKDSTIITIPYRIDEYTDITGEQLYKLMNKYFYELMKVNDIKLELEP